MHLGVIPFHTRVSSSSSQDTTRPHAASGGTTKTHPGALIVVSGHYRATCCTWGCHQNTPGCAYRRRRTLQGNMPHLGVQPKHTRVHLSSSQDTTGQHAAPGGTTKIHPGALTVVSGHYKATCRTWGCHQNTPECAQRRLRTLQGHMPHLGVQPKHTRVRLPSSLETTSPHAAPGGAIKTHLSALTVVSGHYRATCCTWEYNQNTPGCAHRRLRTLQGHLLHLGVQPKHTRVQFCW